MRLTADKNLPLLILYLVSTATIKTLYLVSTDSNPQVKFDKIPTLRTVFDKAGTITAANSSKLSDGAAACVLMSRDMADKLGLEPLAKILSEYKSGFCYFLLK